MFFIKTCEDGIIIFLLITMRLLFKFESRAGHPRQRANDVKDKIDIEM